jgi:SAM-dependent methyltransferase
MFWSETLGYRDYRPPYLPGFFAEVARRLPLLGTEHLLDLGCGTGTVALGFAPYVASITGVDLERPMLDEAARRAERQGRTIALIHAAVEEAPTELGPFDLITIGRAHWYMHTPATLARIDGWLKPGGAVLVCAPLDRNHDGAAWREAFSALRRKWMRIPGQKDLWRLTPEDLFTGTAFVAVEEIAVRGSQPIDLDHLVKRMLGFAPTTRAILEGDADRMIEELRASLAPYFRDGPIIEQLVTAGLVFRRGPSAGSSHA